MASLASLLAGVDPARAPVQNALNPQQQMLSLARILADGSTPNTGSPQGLGGFVPSAEGEGLWWDPKGASAPESYYPTGPGIVPGTLDINNTTPAEIFLNSRAGKLKLR